MRLLSFSCWAGVLASVAACALGPLGARAGPTVRVENHASRDVDVYVWTNDERATRLGFVPAGDTAAFVLPRTVTADAQFLHFEARHLYDSGRSATSEPFDPPADATITWSVPPPATAAPAASAGDEADADDEASSGDAP